MPSPFNVRPLGPAIGAEVLDLNLADVFLPETLQALEAALVKHEALVLHVPELTPDQHLAIANHFGEAEVHTFYPNLGAGYEQITLIDSKLGDRADMWHHDESFLPSAPIVTMTQAKILPPCGGDTCWISMTTAYDALSERMKQYLDGLHAWHDMNGPMTAALRQGVVTHDRYLEVIKMGKRHLHPMVTTHPITGTPIVGFEVPFFKEAMDMCLRAALKVPQMRFIAWDVAVTEQGPCFIEGNSFPSHAVPQFAAHYPDGIGIMREFREFIDI